MDCKKDCKKLNIKKFIMGRWLPLILALLIIGLIFTVGFLFGFRIKYAPELKNDWDAISGVAAWVGIVVSIASAVASFMAVWYAVRVADKQNQIALFEKRFELYELYSDCVTFAKKLDYSVQKCDVYKKFMEAFYLKETFGVPDNKLYSMESMVIIERGFDISSKMLSAIFLFEEEIGIHMANVADRMSDVILMEYKEDNEEERKLIIQNFKDEFENGKDENISAKIEKILSIK